MTEQQTIDRISKRIKSEYDKHKTHNWTAILYAENSEGLFSDNVYGFAMVGFQGTNVQPTTNV
jgi:hypothetical protein